MAETNNVDVAAIMNMVAALSPEGSGVRKDVPAESGVSAELERAKAEYAAATSSAVRP